MKKKGRIFLTAEPAARTLLAGEHSPKGFASAGQYIELGSTHVFLLIILVIKIAELSSAQTLFFIYG